MTDPTPAPWIEDENPDTVHFATEGIHPDDEPETEESMTDPTPSSDTPSDERHALEQTADASFPNLPGIKRILLETYDQGRSHGIGHATILSLVYRCEKAEREVLALRHPALSPTPVEASGRPDTAELRGVAALLRLDGYSKGGTFVDEAADEIDRLRRWKAEAMEVLGQWHKVHEALGSPGALGESITAASLAEVERLTAPASPPVGERLDVTTLPEWKALGVAVRSGSSDAVIASLAEVLVAADRGDRA